MNKALKIIIITAGTIMLLLGSLFVIGFWPGSTKDIESVANMFEPGEDWQLESETINPPRLICLQADCGEVLRVWHRSEAPEDMEAELTALASIYQNGVTTRADCDGNVEILACRTNVSLEEGDVRVTMYRSGTTNRPTLTLKVESR